MKFNRLSPLHWTFLLFVMTSCGRVEDPKEVTIQKSFLSSYSIKSNALKVSLSNINNDGFESGLFSSVVVNIDYITVNGNTGIVLAQDVGPVDLMTLYRGLMLDLGEQDIPVGTTVNQIRMMLKSEGNYVQYANGDICQLQIPSQIQSGLKINAPKFEIESGQAYSMVIDFNAFKSVVHQGHGGCLLKPVIKYAGISRVDDQEIDDDGSTESPSEEEIPEDDSEVIIEDPNEEPSEDPISVDDTSSGGDTPTEDDTSSGGDIPTGDDQLADCNAVNPNDPSTWPENIDWADYAHCD